MKNPILIISTIFAAVALAWLEIDIDKSIGWGQILAICSIGVSRLVLFYESGQMWGKDKGRAKWVTFFSVVLAVVVFFYAENIEGVSNNARILYHTCNAVLLFLEWTLAFKMINKGNDVIKQWEEAFDELEKETDREREEKERLEKEIRLLKIDLASNSQRLEGFESTKRDSESLIVELRNQTKESESKAKQYETQLKTYENIKPMIDKVFTDGNVFRVLDSETGELLSFGRGKNEVKTKTGRIYVKPINGKVKS